MKFIAIEKVGIASKIIINLDRVNHVDINTKSNLCKVFYSEKDFTVFSGNEVAQLIQGIKQYNDQLLVNLCGETEF